MHISSSEVLDRRHSVGHRIDASLDSAGTSIFMFVVAVHRVSFRRAQWLSLIAGLLCTGPEILVNAFIVDDFDFEDGRLGAPSALTPVAVVRLVFIVCMPISRSFGTCWH